MSASSHGVQHHHDNVEHAVHAGLARSEDGELQHPSSHVPHRCSPCLGVLGVEGEVIGPAVGPISSVPGHAPETSEYVHYICCGISKGISRLCLIVRVHHAATDVVINDKCRISNKFSI